MIVQVDHIALSSTNINEDIKTIKLLGYNLVFLEAGIQNPAIKSKFMKEPVKYHSLALLRCMGCVSIELIDHGHTSPNVSYITPVFKDAPKDLLYEAISTTMLRRFDIPVYAIESEKRDPFRFNQIIIRTKDIEGSKSFWHCLGFKTIRDEGKTTLVEFSSPLDKEIFQVCLQEEAATGSTYYLDDKGFNCVALISSSAEKERESLNKRGFDTTEIEELKVNGRKLKIFFSTGPSGELVEIIGL